MWNQHLQNATNKWDIMEKDFPNQFTVSANLLLGSESVTFLPLINAEAPGGYTHRERSDPGYDSAFEEIYNDVYMENCWY